MVSQSKAVPDTGLRQRSQEHERSHKRDRDAGKNNQPRGLYKTGGKIFRYHIHRQKGQLGLPGTWHLITLTPSHAHGPRQKKSY